MRQYYYTALVSTPTSRANVAFHKMNQCIPSKILCNDGNYPIYINNAVTISITNIFFSILHVSHDMFI